MQALSVFDFLIIIFIISSVLISLSRTMARDIVAFCGLIIAVMISLMFEPYISPVFYAIFASPFWGIVFAFISIFILVQFLFTLFTNRIILSLEVQRGFSISSFLGRIGLGTLRGLFILSICYVFFDSVVPQNNRPTFITTARSSALLQETGPIVNIFIRTSQRNGLAQGGQDLFPKHTPKQNLLTEQQQQALIRKNAELLAQQLYKKKIEELRAQALRARQQKLRE